MATLPAHHPRLAIHLTDRVLTPVISSSSSSNLVEPATTTKRPIFSSSSSPSSPSSSPTSSASASNDDDHPSAAPLATLTHTSLLSYQTAKRLDRGAPLRTIVEYPHAGPVVLHSYLCPMSLALGTPGLGRRRASQDSLMTAAGGGAAAAAAAEAEDEESRGEGAGENEGQGSTATAIKGKDVAIAGVGGEGQEQGREDNGDEDDDDPDGPNAPPMLIATVVAPTGRDLKEARRAAGRLERIARTVQTEWVAEGPGT